MGQSALLLLNIVASHSCTEEKLWAISCEPWVFLLTARSSRL